MLAVARHEGRRAFAFADRRTAIAFLGVALLLAASWPLVARNPIAPDADLYPVVVDPASPYSDAIDSDHRFRTVAGDLDDLRAGHVAFVATATDVHFDPDESRSVAAVQALGQATRRWLEDRLLHEGDAAAAFPVEVSLLAENAFADSGAAPPPENAAGPGDDGVDRGLLVQTVTDAREGLKPSEVDPPFPVRSLLLTFAFLIPMNLVGQLYSGSLLADRTRDRGLILLSAPMSGPAILLGRTLPYALISVLVVLVAAWATGAGPLGAAAGLPMVLVVVALAMVLGLLARNERELTFLLTGGTTMLSTFLFLPAVFTQMPAVAFVSPVSVVSASIEGDPVTWGAFLYSTVPLSLVTVALGLIGLALYREETLFSSADLTPKAMEGLSRLTRRGWHVLAAGALAVPFALALELFVLALVIPLGLRAAFPLFVLGVAFVEEGLKLLPTRAHVLRGSLPGWKAGALSGAGFFVGEKLALLVALAGFGLLPFGETTLALWGVGAGIALLVAPLVLHVATAALSGSAVRAGRGARVAAYFGAVLVHAAYNVAVVMLL